MLLTDANPGLEIQALDGKWLPVLSGKGAFIVNLGEAKHLATLVEW